MKDVLRELRNLSPKRPLRFPEATFVAELQATRLLAAAQVFGPPVPDWVVTSFPRVEVERIEGLRPSGATRWENGRWLILLKADEPYVRQRFSAVHELKHVIDHIVAEIAYPAALGFSAEDRRELVANHFAASVLMPKAWIKRAWREGVQEVRDLADLFEVSREAMRIRLQTIGLVEPTKRCELVA